MFKKLIISGEIIELYEYEHSRSETQNVFKRKNVYGSLEGDRRKITSEAHRLVKRQDNARRASLAFRRLVQANLASDSPPILSTFTFKNEVSISQGFRLFSSFAKRLRLLFGVNISYIAVPEFGTRNTQRLHFHALFWGLPLDKVKQERESRYFAQIWKYGFIDLVVTDNNPKVGYYLSKYLKKAYLDPRFFSHKTYTTSRNIIRPVEHRSFVSMILDFEVGVDNLTLHDHRKYETIWLGECNFNLYKDCSKKPNANEN